MRKIIIAFFIFTFISLSAQEIVISDSARISLITCSPGEELYSKFGHTAIRIQDSQNKIDVVFNYGIFSFETENFYYKFVKGETDYQLGVYDTQLFLPEYAERNSTVWEQELAFSVAEKRNLINALLTNYLPENKLYRYNFVYDNCATRPLNIIKSSINGHLEYKNAGDPLTFRQWVNEYVAPNSWAGFGIDLVFGIDADRNVSIYESMFLPEVLMDQFQHAVIVSNGRERRNLTKERMVLVGSGDKKIEESKGVFSNPLYTSLLFLLTGVIVTFFIGRQRTIIKSFDSILLFTSGLTGLILVYMMTFSLHPLVGSNFNILWLNPLNIVAAFFIWFRSMRKVLFFYQIVNISFLVIALFTFGTSIQSFNMAVFPIIVLMLLRYTRWASRAKTKLYTIRPKRSSNSSQKGF